MTSVATVFHSGFGHTKVQAEAVHRGVLSVTGVTAHLISVEAVESRWDDLDAADALIFGTPTYMAGPSAAFKAFVDATSSRWAQQAWKDKLAAGFTNSAGYSGDKLATLQALQLFAMQHSMVWVSLGLLPGSVTIPESPGELNRLAAFAGAMAQSDPDAAPTSAPGPSDQRTAEHLGRRVAEAALRWSGRAPHERARSAVDALV